LNKKHVLVTGAARGLGRAIVDSLVASGWEVWATDVLEIAATGTRAQHRAVMDVANRESIERLVESNPDGFDGLVNNAAIMPLVRWDELDLATWQRTLEVNLTGPFLCSQVMGRAMCQTGRGGAIVNISSVTFFQGNPLGVHYTASKGGVVALTRSLACALGEYRIRVNCVAPGIMRTEGVMEQVERGVLPGERLLGDSDPSRTLPGRTEPSGVADIVTFLLSDGARELTGQLLVASGGSYLY
jgi:pyridoxal 4-dehydrogenase